MDRETLRKRVSSTQTLPTLPLIRERALAVLDDPQSTIKDVSAIVSTDPVLTARLLQVVDWRRSIFADRVPSVNKAVSAAGFEAIRRLVRSQSVLDLAATEASYSHAFDVKQLWLHSLATAIAAQTIAAHSGYPDPGECYVTGLLHDIGKMVMYHLFRERFYTTIAQAADVHNTFYYCEVESGEASHAVIGQILVEQWAFPPKVIEAIWRHHTPQLAENYPKIASITHMADVFARALGLGSGGDPYVPAPRPAGLTGVGLRAGQIEAVMTEIEQEFTKAAALLA